MRMSHACRRARRHRLPRGNPTAEAACWQTWSSARIPWPCWPSLSATTTPGGATLLATASGARFGLRRSLPVLAGISAGLAALAASAGAGIGTLLQAAPVLQSGTRVAGSAYLLWLAWKIARAGAPDLRRAEGRSPLGFLSGVVLLWLNRKAG